jgi:quaternary ammonium compound-resistance protein SugE
LARFSFATGRISGDCGNKERNSKVSRCHILVARTSQGVGTTNRDEIAMTGWLAVLAAGLFEIAWAFGLRYSDGLTRFWPTVATGLAILASFSLMAFALKSLPFGTAYAIWAGIGAAGSIILGMVIFSEPTDPVRIICLTLIVAGIVGLKLNSPV